MWRRTRTAVVLALAVVSFGSRLASARPPHDPEHPLFIEFAAGTTQPGPDGTAIGAGQSYLAQLGWRTHSWSDVGVLLAFSHTRDDGQATETDITSGGVRARGWLGSGRWTPYAEVGARLYSFDTQFSDASFGSASDRTTAFGGELGGGVLYSRSTWWIGLGAELHSAFAEVGIDGGNLLTYTTYNVIFGAPIGGGGSGGR